MDTRWVDARQKSGSVRSRLVCREIKARAKLAKAGGLAPEDVFSAMPPVESLETLLAVWAAEGKDATGEDLRMGVWDVSRAHFYGKARRPIYIKLPPELHQPGKLGLLLKTMYGVRDASSVWLETWNDHLRNNGFSVGRANPALSHDDERKGFCHGDDLCVLGSRKALLDFDAILKKAFDVKCMGVIGYAEDQKEVQVLNRTIRVVSDKGHVELEPDSRLVKKILDDYNLHGAKLVPTPRVKKATRRIS